MTSTRYSVMERGFVRERDLNKRMWKRSKEFY
jgi:hypothetical protein